MRSVGEDAPDLPSLNSEHTVFSSTACRRCTTMPLPAPTLHKSYSPSAHGGTGACHYEPAAAEPAVIYPAVAKGPRSHASVARAVDMDASSHGDAEVDMDPIRKSGMRTELVTGARCGVERGRRAGSVRQSNTRAKWPSLQPKKKPP